MISVFIFIYGLVLGSFFNVVGLRVPMKESIVSPPSHCPNCQTNLRAIDLIPVVSYIFQRGKCRYCKTHIPLMYPFFEILTALLFFIGFQMYGLTSMFLLFSLVVSLLIIITISDLAYKLIPDKVLLLFLCVFLINQTIFQPITWSDCLLGFFVSFIVLYVIAVLSKGGMGGGDIKLFGVLGIVLGWQGFIITFLFASFLGAIYGIVGKIISHGQLKEIAFGPFIAIGTIITFLWKEPLIDWYLGLIY